MKGRCAAAEPREPKADRRRCSAAEPRMELTADRRRCSAAEPRAERSSRPTGGAVPPPSRGRSGAHGRQEALCAGGAMEPGLWSGPRRHRLPGPAASGFSRIHVRSLLLLLLLLPRKPAGCLSAGEARGTPSTTTTTWTHPGEPRDPGRPRLPRQDDPATDSPVTLSSGPPASTSKPSWAPTCGQSYEQDPTLRDPEAMTRRWPWMVSVQANGMHVCAGTLIASRWVLIAAHCLTEDGNNYTVRVGSPWINETAKTSSDVPVLQVIINSGYQAQRYWSWVGRVNDIGLLRLQPGLMLSKYVWPICLPGLDYVLKDNAQCTVTGWGHSDKDNNSVWPQFLTLQEKEVTILNNKECERFYHKSAKIPFLVQIISTQMICVKDQDRKRFCYEITGEPLVCTSNNQWYLVGIMSWGPGCSKAETPPIFLQVSSFHPWIWDRLSGQSESLLVPSRTLLLLALCSLLAAL